MLKNILSNFIKPNGLMILLALGLSVITGLITWHYVDKNNAVKYANELNNKNIIIETQNNRLANIRNSIKIEKETNRMLQKEIRLSNLNNTRLDNDINEYAKNTTLNSDCVVSDDLSNWLLNFKDYKPK